MRNGTTSGQFVRLKVVEKVGARDAEYTSKGLY